ncbi:MAG: riboflavin synthase [Gemmatimonadetes bacterium]|nr:riboflavin synthase [Gemmatimonadota bacterium]
MFTGLVEGLGSVLEVAERAEGRTFTIDAGPFGADLAAGDSIAVNGVCLTATTVDGSVFTTDVLVETLNRTSFRTLSRGDRVNLEKPLRAADRLGGHFVQGHVDGIATITHVTTEGPDWRLTLALPRSMRRYAVEKGSIALDGVSLTIASLEDDGAHFDVALIPETVSRTTLGIKTVGDPVHVEVDILAKYVERMLHTSQSRQEQQS